MPAEPRTHKSPDDPPGTRSEDRPSERARDAMEQSSDRQASSVTPPLLTSKPPGLASTRPDPHRTPDVFLGHRVGSFQLQRLLGSGPVGATYEATSADGGRAAVKLLQPEYVHEAMLAVVRDAATEPGAEHLARVLEYGKTPKGLAYVATELLQGRDLTAVLERTGVLQPVTATRLALQACAGLEVVHRAGIVHADLKPSNLFLAFEADNRVTLKLLDFGIAKRVDLYNDHDLTRTGASLGSPLYMAPEQLTGVGGIDARTDVWSLAVTLYELLCGVTPYGDSGTLTDLVVSICTTNGTPVQERAPWMKPDLALALHSAMHRMPDQRTASVAEFSRALRACVGADSGVRRAELVPPTPDVKSRLEPLADLASILPPEGDAFGKRRASAEIDPFVGKLIGGKYRVVRLLGRGGMGRVYEAATPSDSHVALKLVSTDGDRGDGTMISRFVREAKAAMSIDNPHVVRTLDAGVDEATSSRFIAMELLHGVDLAVLYRRHGALEQDALARVFLQAAKGVAAAHAAGVIHRDIKPSNIFLATDSRTGKVAVKVCDFGVAKRLTSELDEDTVQHDLTQTGGILGSPMYMSPEQVQSAKHVDFRSDVWSLAISLYEGLAGRQPWHGCDTIGQLIVAICTRDLPPLGEVSPWVTPALARAVHAALERERKLRTGSIAEVIAELASLTGGKDEVSRDELRGVEHVVRAKASSRPPPPSVDVTGAGADFLRSARRRRLLWSAGATAAALFVAGVWAIARQTPSAMELAPAPSAATSPVTSTAPAAAAPPAVAQPTAVQPAPGIFHAPIAIDPPDAIVMLDGRPAVVLDGKLTLHGQAGVAFQVTLSKGTARREVTAFITFDGKAAPAEISLVPAVAPIAEAPAPETARRASKRRGGVRPAAEPVPAAADESRARATPAAESKAKSGAIAPVDNW